jgi:GrpB-like predicted nucleotidyltransferase (UPF0157 family)
MVRRIEVLPHDPRWAALFRQEADALAALLGEALAAIHHIGSTAIPGVSAKPIIDLLVEVRAIEAVDALTPQFVTAGYLPRGENGIVGRRFYFKGTEEQRSHHIHTFQQGSPEIARYLAFRDYMIAHPEDAAAYSRLKEELARRFPDDAAGYVAGKDAFVREMERRALAWRARGTAPQ